MPKSETFWSWAYRKVYVNSLFQYQNPSFPPFPSFPLMGAKITIYSDNCSYHCLEDFTPILYLILATYPHERQMWKRMLLEIHSLSPHSQVSMYLMTSTQSAVVLEQKTNHKGWLLPVYEIVLSIVARPAPSLYFIVLNIVLTIAHMFISLFIAHLIWITIYLAEELCLPWSLIIPSSQ